MSSTLRYYWESLRTSYWFLPAVLGLAAIGLSFVTIAIDRELLKHASWRVEWTYSGGPEGARAVLATIAGSMITVAGIVFSITTVALSLASGQYGSRLLRNFIRDRRNQFMLGTFTATFLYCLLVLRTVRGIDHDPFVPGVSVTVGILLAITNLGVLIFFIHHVAISIQAASVIQAVMDELYEAIDRLWPEELGEEETPPDDSWRQRFEEPTDPIVATSSGYVDAINNESLMAITKERDLVIRVARRPGHFVIQGSPLAWAAGKKTVEEDAVKQLSKAFTMVPQRTPFQDVEFAIDQLVEVAVRALSPGINDPFTAMNCIDRLGEALSRLAQRSIPSPLRYDSDQRLRVITYPADFRAVTDAAFNQIRQYGAGSPAVLIRLLDVIGAVISLARRDADRLALAHHAELVLRTASRNVAEEADLEDIKERYAEVRRRIELHARKDAKGERRNASD
jgi:uncharacterized membrane protein